MKEALVEVPFAGLKNNREFLLKTLDHQKFLAGETYTHFIDRHQDELLGMNHPEELEFIAAIGMLLNRNKTNGDKRVVQNKMESPWQTLGGFRNI